MSVYYNEIDRFAVAWLRELMKAKVIPDGEIDTRSIRDVRPDDLRGFRQCHFFAGIGGWAYALRLAGWPDDRDVWTGSCPCQPWSVAGKGGGADDPRDLWPAWFPLIRERRPPTIFGEQTSSTDGEYWLDVVSVQMEGIDYAIGTLDLPAACVGAPHGRPRFWIVADNHRDGRAEFTATRAHDHGESGDDALRCGARGGRSVEHATGGERARGTRDEARARRTAQGGGQGEGGRVVQSRDAGDLDVADAPRGGQRTDGRASRPTGHVDERGTSGDLADSNSTGRGGRRRGRCDQARDAGAQPDVGGTTSNLENSARRRREQCDEGYGIQFSNATGAAGGVGESAGEGPQGRAIEGAAGSLWEGTATQRTGPTSGFWFPCDWIPCREPDGTIKARAVEPGTFPLANGISGRVGRLRGYGNAIVPQVAAEVIAAYMEVRGL